MYVFYPGTPIPAEFEQLGFVTATGDQSSDDRKVLSDLKIKALKTGADAIIEVNRRIEPRESGLILGDDKDNYNAISYQGTAIRFTNLESLLEHIKIHMESPDYQSHKLCAMIIIKKITALWLN